MSLTTDTFITNTGNTCKKYFIFIFCVQWDNFFKKCVNFMLKQDVMQSRSFKNYILNVHIFCPINFTKLAYHCWVTANMWYVYTMVRTRIANFAKHITLWTCSLFMVQEGATEMKMNGEGVLFLFSHAWITTTMVPLLTKQWTVPYKIPA